VLAETDATGTLQAQYVYGAGLDEPLRMVRGGVTSYYHADGLGSVVGLSQSAGALVERYAYDVYGTPRITNAGGTVLTQSAIGNRFLFTGREWDAAPELYHYRARYYEPWIGRFYQRDPIGLDSEDINLYAYVFNNPINGVDPFGLSFIPSLQGPPFVIDLQPERPAPPLGDPIPQPSLVPPGDAGQLVGPTILTTPATPIGGSRQCASQGVERASQEKGKGRDRTPSKGRPGSSREFPKEGGRQIRDYGPDGRAIRDIDYGHSHGAGDPHVHDWNWGKPGQERGRGRPPRPGEIP